MTKQNLFKTLVLLFTLGCFFISCNEQDSTYSNPSYKKLEVTEHLRNDANKMSKDVARLHDVLLTNFLCKYYKPSENYTIEMHNGLCEYINGLLEQEGYEKTQVNCEDIIKMSSYDNLLSALKDIPNQESFNIETIYDNSMKFETKVYELFDMFAVNIDYTIDDLTNDYNMFVEEMLRKENNMVNYTASRVYADMYLSSIKTWISYYYEQEHSSNAKWPTFKEMKDFVKEGVKLVVPAVKEDAKVAASTTASIVVGYGGTAVLTAPATVSGIVGISGISSMVTLYKKINGKNK